MNKLRFEKRSVYFLKSLFLLTVVRKLCQFYFLVGKEFNNGFIAQVAFLSYFLIIEKIFVLVERIYPESSFLCSCMQVFFQEGYCCWFNIMRAVKDFQSGTKSEVTGTN